MTNIPAHRTHTDEHEHTFNQERQAWHEMNARAVDEGKQQTSDEV